jgi:uncharacterized damage-inducible protein DinB
MFTLDGTRQFHTWTHQSLSLLFDHLDTLTAAGYTQVVPGFGFPTVRAQVVHLLGCEIRWVNRLRGLPNEDWDAARWPTVSDARVLQSQARSRTLDYLASLTDHHLNVNAELRFADGEIAYSTPALILHHVLTHAFHHKGQIVAMCRILSLPAPDTDLNQFG